MPKIDIVESIVMCLHWLRISLRVKYVVDILPQSMTEKRARIRLFGYTGRNWI